jgi:hypothetical protein
MAKLFNTEGRRRARLFRLLGSFWTSVFQDRLIAQGLVALSRVSPAWSSFVALVHNLAGHREQGSLRRNQLVYFNPDQVVETGTLAYTEDGPTRYADIGAIYGDQEARYYALPLPGDIVPQSILAYDRVLLLGVDFFLQGDRWLYFRNDPRRLFPGSVYLMLLGRDRQYRSLLQPLTGVGYSPHESMVVRFLRHQQTPAAFERALAAAGGLALLTTGQKLLSVRVENNHTHYLFEQETVHVDYPHTPLPAGRFYPAGTVFGQGVKLYYSDGTAKAWWRQVDWRGGLCLDPLLNQPGLVLLDRIVPAYAAGQDDGSVAGSRVHARFPLGDAPSRELAYWAAVARRETQTGVYLNRLLHLPEEVDSGDPQRLDTYAKLMTAHATAQALNRIWRQPAEEPAVGALPQVRQVNALDAFFQAGLGQNCFVVLLRLEEVPQPDLLLAFLQRHQLAGGLPIIFAYGPAGLGESVDVMGLWSEGLSITPVVPQTFTETTDLATLFHERVTLRPEQPVNHAQSF